MTQQEMFGQAQWVCAGTYNPGNTLELDQGGVPHFPILRSHFSAVSVKKATLRLLGLGFFHAYINGEEVTDDRFVPLSTDYEPRDNYPTEEVLFGHRIYVPEYDVTHLLREGENVLALHFGGGWYTYNSEGSKFADPKAIFRLILETESGTEEILSSCYDKIGDSYVKTYNFTRFENQDYRGFDDRVFGLDYDDSSWAQAQPANPLKTEYLFTDCPADREMELLSPVCIFREGDTAVYDIGINCANIPVLKLTGAAGESVKVAFSEEKTVENRPVLGWDWDIQSTSFISDGTGRVVKPMFTWFAYRYVEVKGNAELLGARVIHSNVNVTAEFNCDNTTLNWLFEAFLNTQLSNMHAGIPSDCPHYERLGYTGDGQLACRAAMSVLDAKSFYRKWIDDISDCQDVLTGHVQYTAPYHHAGGGPGGWGCAIVEVPYQFYLQYGDAEPMKRLYPQMLRYFDFLEAHTENGLITSDKKGDWCLGDWCAPGVVALPGAFVNNYFYVKSLGRAVEIAKMLGKTEDIPMLEQRIVERKAALMGAYYNFWDGNFIGAFQGANAFAVDIGIGDERTYRNMVQYYEQLGHFDTGIFGTDVLSRVLFEHGDGELAVKLLTADHLTSFEGMRRAGSTTIWEYWPEESGDRSHNHPMFGAVVAHLFDYLLGIGQDGVGYRKIIIRPQLVGKLNRASGKRVLPCGEVSVTWERQDGGVLFNITVPAGVEAEFMYNGTTYPLAAGENRINVK